MRNPLHDLLHHEAEDGPPIEWSVPRASATPLTMRLVLPEDRRLVEVADLVGAAKDAPAWVHERSASLQEAARAAGAVIVGVLTPADDPTQVLATLTVLFTENLGDEMLTVPDFTPGGDCLSQDVEELGPFTTRIDRLYAIEPTPGAGKIPMLVELWLVKTRFGGIAIAFETTDEAGGSQEMERFFKRVAFGVTIRDPDADENHG